MIDSDYCSVCEQIGIVVGSGGFLLQVGGNIYFVGVVIGSIVDLFKNQLFMGSLLFEELKNCVEFFFVFISGGISGGGNFLDGFLFDLLLVFGLLIGGSKSFIICSGLVDGIVEICNGDDFVLVGLQCGVMGLDNVNGFVLIFDERKVQERQELIQMLGVIGFEVIGNLVVNKIVQVNVDFEVVCVNGDVEVEVDVFWWIEQWGEGGCNKVLLYGLIGVVVVVLSGGDIGGDVVGVVGFELVKDVMIRFFMGQGLDLCSVEFNSLIEIVSVVLGGVIGGSDGVVVVLLGDWFNCQLYFDEVVWINIYVVKFVEQEGISEEEVCCRLIVEGVLCVDVRVNKLIGEENVDDVVIVFFSIMGGKYGFGVMEVEYNNFNFYGNELFKDDVLYWQVFNFLFVVGVFRDDLNYIFFDLNNLRGMVGCGCDGQMMFENFSGDVGVVGSLIVSLF